MYVNHGYPDAAVPQLKSIDNAKYAAWVASIRQALQSLHYYYCSYFYMFSSPNGLGKSSLYKGVISVLQGSMRRWI